ncbi:MAG: hypothetical protein HUU54_15520 [Ignavibacteriaceae bacterium]|nr:hypothetical protein [Ignavibacteriaceae bacterium]
MKRMTTYIIALFTVVFLQQTLYAQFESQALNFNRGKLWQSIFNGKIGPSFNNWRRIGIGLDWPGFEPSWITENIGGAPSYMITGGFIVGAKKAPDSVLVVEDWSIAGNTIAPDNSAKYKITKNTHLFKNGENYWLKKDAKNGEEVIESSWEYNVLYSDEFGIQRQLPVRMTRSAHQWSGSMRNENYVLYRYVIKNISPELKTYFVTQGDTDRAKTIPDTLYDFYAMLNYALHSNSRAWNVLFPTETPGAKNTWFFYDIARRMIWGRAGDFLKTSKVEPSYGFSNSLGRIVNGQPSGEWLAPGYVGLRLVYSSPNKNGQSTVVNAYGWSAGDDAFDFGGPLSNKNTEESQYELIKNPSVAPNYVANSADTVFMQRSRMWSMMSLGPWNILPGDSVVIAVAEIVDGADYKFALDKNALTQIGAGGLKSFQESADKAKFTFDQYLKGNGFNHPDPPAAPVFTVDYYKETEGFVANVISWGNETEAIPDPDDGTLDLIGYKVYRSDYLPIGPWDSIGVVYRGDPVRFNSTTQKYSFVDSTASIGRSYYYALTAFDTGKAAWTVDATARFPETGNTNRVPRLESSVYANKKITRFTTTIPPLANLDKVLVVPNPFVLGKGVASPGETDLIQFVNIPNPCVIRIYTVRGDLVKTINVDEGVGAVVSWNQVTDYGQYIESGVYIYHVDSKVGTKIGKFAVVR